MMSTNNGREEQVSVSVEGPDAERRALDRFGVSP